MATGTVAAQDAANAVFRALEDRLLEAEKLSFSFDIRAVGPVPAVLVGNAVIGPAETARLVADGSFAGDDAAIRLESDGRGMAGGNGDAVFQAESPPALRQGLLIGLTRMGLLHNLAVLSAGSPPDRVDGSVTDWVTYSDMTLGPEESLGGVTARRFSFTVVVSGVPSASAELWVEAASGLPIRRVQIMNFPEGEMRVLEQYSDFSVTSGN
ncbi:MAG: hypothetical protein PVH13_05930 [Gammaproteobacteria bacterium]|jgi:hypothetical protein|nr:MAG: hypothetical protein AMJ59_18825 [Gammaproteobacteria bacterium SG8_31]